MFVVAKLGVLFAAVVMAVALAWELQPLLLEASEDTRELIVFWLIAWGVFSWLYIMLPIIHDPAASN